MARPKTERHSSDLAAEIARLEQERKRLIQTEDQRRGAIIRDLLSGQSGDSLRSVLHPIVNGRDAFLFGLDAAPAIKPAGARSRATGSRSVVESNSRQPGETAAAG